MIIASGHTIRKQMWAKCEYCGKIARCRSWRRSCQTPTIPDSMELSVSIFLCSECEVHDCGVRALLEARRSLSLDGNPTAQTPSLRILSSTRLGRFAKKMAKAILARRSDRILGPVEAADPSHECFLGHRRLLPETGS
jgi:hypothetical protein